MVNYDPTIGAANPAGSNEDIVTMDSEVSFESRCKDPIEYVFAQKSLRIGTPYKVNVHAVITFANLNVESKELHQKI